MFFRIKIVFMNDNISFKHLRTIIKTKGCTSGEFASKCNRQVSFLSQITTGQSNPKTDLLARMCSVLKVYPSEIVSFEGIDINPKYFSNDKRLPLPNEFTGELTYKPLWYFLDDYLAEVNKNRAEGEPKKTANDLFNKIEPPRRVKGDTSAYREISLKGIAARYGESYVAKGTVHTDYSKGLPGITRTKLRNDRPLNLEVIYEICKFLGCSIDFVLGYK